MKIKINHGVIIEKKPTDFIAGAESGVVFEIINPNADWTVYLPIDETQAHSFDTMACVTFSALNVVETQVKKMIADNKISADKIKKLQDWGYIDKSGELNFSDRFTAKMSGTTPNGNTLQNVWDSIRKDGLLPEAMWPFDALTFADYYKEIPQDLKDFAKNILTIFDFAYEWIVMNSCNYTNFDLLKQQLKQAPLQLAAPVCSRDQNGIIVPCGTCITQHATMLYYIDNYVYQFDHYYPFRNKLALNYALPYIMKAVVTLKTPVTPPNPSIFNHMFLVDISYGQTSEEVKWLQRALNLLENAKIPVTGYYFEITRNAVKSFQWKYKVANSVILLWNNGKLVASSTRAKLNELLSKLR